MGKRRKNKKKKGSDVSWFGNQDKKETGVVKSLPKKGSIWSRSGTKPTEGKDPNTLSIILYKQSVLDEIAAMCKPKAGRAEFQVHHRGAQFIIEKPGEDKRIVFTIPTYFFNMPQKVTSGSVDFNLDEVKEISDQIADLSVDMVNKLAGAFPIAFFEGLGYTVKIRELEMGSLHRHPGNFGFSTIDMDNQVEKPGVIFRNLGCDDKIQVDSVMYIPGDTNQIVVTETRVVDVHAVEDGIEGTYKETPTICCILKDVAKTTGFGEFFGRESSDDQTEYKFKVQKDGVTEEYPEIEDVLSVFLESSDYEPGLIIDPELIVQQTYTYSYNRSGTTYGKGKTYNRSKGSYWDDYYSDWEDDGLDVEVPAGSLTNDEKPTKEEKKELERPTWRKRQVMASLRVKGVDTVGTKIDGSGSKADAIDIASALKEQQYTDQEIRTLFETWGYSPESLNWYYEDLANSI